MRHEPEAARDRKTTAGDLYTHVVERRELALHALSELTALQAERLLQAPMLIPA